MQVLFSSQNRVDRVRLKRNPLWTLGLKTWKCVGCMHQNRLVQCILYFFTFFALTLFGARLFSLDRSWQFFSVGLPIAVLGSYLSYLFVLSEKKVAVVVSSLEESYASSTTELEKTIDVNREQIAELEDVEKAKNEHIQSLEKERENTEMQIQDLLREFQDYQKTSREEIERQAAHLKEYQETIAQQRDVIERKQKQIGEFESKVHDLKYELNVLLQLADLNHSSDKPAPSSLPEEETTLIYDCHIHTSNEAAQELKKCINIAQKMTSANYFNGNTRLRSMSVDGFALDLRRLFDALQSENAGVVFVYSRKEGRILFVNQQIRSLIGWAPEKFVKQFSDLIGESTDTWSDGVKQLAQKGESAFAMKVQMQNSDIKEFRCHLGTIPTGLFRNYAIGILY